MNEAVALLTAASEVLREGPAPHRAWLSRIPELASALGVSDDELAAEHERVLGREVFAHESVFLSDEGVRGSTWIEAYGAWGLEVPDEPDALAEEVLLYAYLLDRSPRAAREFLEDHLGRWLAPAAVALERVGSPVYQEVAGLLLELVPVRDLEAHLSPPEALLEDPSTGLARLSRHLLLPARSGWFLSMAAVEDVAGRLDLPCGFGSRVKRLESLWFAAVDHGRVGDLVSELLADLAAWEGRYLEVGATAWRERLGHTRGLLETVAASRRPRSRPPAESG